LAAHRWTAEYLRFGLRPEIADGMFEEGKSEHHTTTPFGESLLAPFSHPHTYSNLFKLDVRVLGLAREAKVWQGVGKADWMGQHVS
jgi:hypothetical protein